MYYGLFDGLDIHCLYRREASLTQLSIPYLHASAAISVFTYLLRIKGKKTKKDDFPLITSTIHFFYLYLCIDKSIYAVHTPNFFRG